MKKIKEIIVGTNNNGKYKEICDLLPNEIKKYSPKEFKISSPEEIGKSFVENSMIKASYFSKKTGLICLADDSGLEIDILNKKPGIFSSRWADKFGGFHNAMTEILKKVKYIKITNESDLENGDILIIVDSSIEKKVEQYKRLKLVCSKIFLQIKLRNLFC